MSEVKVPDIGDFSDVPVIEVLVSVGDEVEAEQGLLTLESDKATMDVPSPRPAWSKRFWSRWGTRSAKGMRLWCYRGGGGEGDAGGEVRGLRV